MKSSKYLSFSLSLSLSLSIPVKTLNNVSNIMKNLKEYKKNQCLENLIKYPKFHKLQYIKSVIVKIPFIL